MIHELFSLEPGGAVVHYGIVDAHGNEVHVQPIPEDRRDPFWEREMQIARECFPEYSDSPWVKLVW